MIDKFLTHFICLNGDTFFDFDYKLFESVYAGETELNKMILRQVDNATRYGSVDLNQNGFITTFMEKNQDCIPGLINSGVYFLHRSIIEHIGEGKVSLETEVFPKLVELQKLVGIEAAGTFIDIGIPDDFNKSQILLKPYFGD